MPATDFSIGADTALNNIVDAIDKIKYTASSTHRAFVIEVMGDECGYLPLMSSLASGAEQAYLPEHGITLDALSADVRALRQGFHKGKSLGILIMGEHASRHYNTDVIRRVMEEEGRDEFDVRAVILGHLQRGGVPSPFDRIQASRFAHHAVRYLLEQMANQEIGANCVGLLGKRVEVTSLEQAMAMLDAGQGRPRDQWWMDLYELAYRLSNPPAA